MVSLTIIAILLMVMMRLMVAIWHEYEKRAGDGQ